MSIKIPLQIIEPEEQNFHVVINSKFDDGTTGHWIIDTGASKTVFDMNKTNHYHKCEEEEEILSAGFGDKPLKSAMAILKPVWFGKLKTENIKVALLDMSHINDFYRKKANIEICGFIGGDFLMKYKAEISYKEKLLILND